MPPAKNSSKLKPEMQNTKLTDFFTPKSKPSALREETMRGPNISMSRDERRLTERNLTVPNTPKQIPKSGGSSSCASHTTTTNRKASAMKRKSTPDSEESEDDMPRTRRTQGNAIQKPKHSTSASKKPCMTPDPEEIAATSQSEEMELDPCWMSESALTCHLMPLKLDSPKDEEVQPHSAGVRSSPLASPPSPEGLLPINDLVTVDLPATSPIELQNSNLPTLDNQANSALQSTRETATERFIRETKERAYKKMLEREEQPLPDIEEDLQSDDDEELFIMPVAKLRKSPKSTSPKDASTRYNLRRHDPAPEQEKMAPQKQLFERQRQASNPLATMLREKKKDERQGIDSEAFRRAEELLVECNQSSKEDSVSEGPSTSKDPSCETGEPGNTVVVNDDERERLLGTEGSKVVGQLLGADKETALPSVLEGIRFWRETLKDDEDGMNIDEPIKWDWPDQTYLSPRLILLRDTLQQNDVGWVSQILATGAIAHWSESELKVAVQQLTHLVLCPTSEPEHLQTLAYWALLQIWMEPRSHSVTLPLPLILEILFQLGAKGDRLSFLPHYPPPPFSCKCDVIDLDLRTTILRRAVSLIAHCTVSHSIALDDIPDVLLLLLQIGMDASTPLDIKLDLTHAINTLCNSFANVTEITPLEIQLCNFVLSLLETYDPLNRRLCLSFLSSGCDRTARMARHISLCVLLDITQFDAYNGSIQVERLLPVLTPHFSEDVCGKFDLNSRTIYEHITAFTHILSIALSDVDSLIVEEATRRKNRNLQLSDVLGQEYKTPLKNIRDALEVLHGKITDTRAAMLDRTQAKAALKTLSMRLWLQETSAESAHKRRPLRSIPGGGPSDRVKPQLGKKQCSLQQFLKP